MAAIFSALPATRLLISPLVTQYSMDMMIGILGKDEFKPIAICANDAGGDSGVVRVKGAGMQSARSSLPRVGRAAKLVSEAN